MSRFAPVCILLFGISSSFAATHSQNIGPQNRFQYSPADAWAKAASHAKAASDASHRDKAKKSGQSAAKDKKASSASPRLAVRHVRPSSLPTGKLGFLAAPQIPAGGTIYNSGVTLSGDFNGDGKEDVVTQVENRVSGNNIYSISVVLSNGDGTFQSPVLTPVPNNDGCAQIMVATSMATEKMTSPWYTSPHVPRAPRALMC